MDHGSVDECPTAWDHRAIHALTMNAGYRVEELRTPLDTDPAETARFSQGSYLSYEDVRRFTTPEQVCAKMRCPQVAAPDGRLLAQAESDYSGVLAVDVDLAKADDKMITARDNVLKDRRSGLYGRVVGAT